MTITQFYSLKENFDFVNAATNSADKAKRIATLKEQFEQSNFSGGDGGDEADFFAPEKAETALFTIKRLVAKAGVQDSIKKYLLQRNSVIKRNKERKAEADRLKQGGYQST
jgi:hypothetical protein